MLVLSRKPNERVLIGENIVVTVLSTKGGTIRLGIEAPADVSIRREELVFELPKAASRSPQRASVAQ